MTIQHTHTQVLKEHRSQPASVKRLSSLICTVGNGLHSRKFFFHPLNNKLFCLTIQNENLQNVFCGHTIYSCEMISSLNVFFQRAISPHCMTSCCTTFICTVNIAIWKWNQPNTQKNLCTVEDKKKTTRGRLSFVERQNGKFLRLFLPKE